ncbi:SDR family NAD(P)-dependent oxidoreductase [uncultured Piscinibacter sp.]|uniref:SDR family NAD(P)-dependent oxidoreductase n=1 Tax=uncultured Piscinibacter sp. TaxID=1131835 RepID=UPI0026386CC2|nr:glucose 1-dehydrogenase [uncultured Piscinibacter sp.]
MSGLDTAFRLDGRVALVTGASSGLGRHFARTLATAGAAVAVAARRADKLQAVVDEIAASGGAAHAVAMDVSDAASVRAGFDAVAAWRAAPDLIVNNAGVAVSRPLLEQSEADWDGVVDTNLKGAWCVAQEGARRLVAAQRPGAVVNIASITGERIAGGVAPYCASKAGLLHLTRAMALELARHGIRVNALAPGYVVTELNRDFLASPAGERLRARIPQQRFGQPEDLDGPLLLLAGDAGRFVTGAVLAVDGGHLVSSL